MENLYDIDFILELVSQNTGIGIDKLDWKPFQETISHNGATVINKDIVSERAYFFAQIELSGGWQIDTYGGYIGTVNTLAPSTAMHRTNLRVATNESTIAPYWWQVTSNYRLFDAYRIATTHATFLGQYTILGIKIFY